MNALVPIDPASATEPLDRGCGHQPVFSPDRQAAFLAHLQLFGNVRLACRSASISAQTAYRARRACAALARAWDAALLAARAHAEATLADRAVNGVEEKVFYHGEEIATRRRYDSRLLLAHLARLDRLAERADLTGALAQLDGWIDGLREGVPLSEIVGPDVVGPEVVGAAEAETSSQDRVPGVPSPSATPPAASPPAAPVSPWDTYWTPGAEWMEEWREALPDGLREEGSWKRRIPPMGYTEWEEDMDDRAHWPEGRYSPPGERRVAALAAGAEAGMSAASATPPAPA